LTAASKESWVFYFHVKIQNDFLCIYESGQQKVDQLFAQDEATQCFHLKLVTTSCFASHGVDYCSWSNG